MTQKKALCGIILSALVSTVLFQNCSQVAATDMTGQEEKLAVDTGDVVDNGDGAQAEDPNQASGNPRTPQTQPQTQVPQSPQTPPKPPVAQPQVLPPAPADVDDDKVCKCMDGKDDCDGSHQDVEPTTNELVELCLKQKKNTMQVSELIDFNGAGVVEANLITRVEKVRGNLILRGKGDKASVRDIKDLRGGLVICGMDVESIDDVRGHIILVNSKVKHLSNHRGTIKTYNNRLVD